MTDVLEEHDKSTFETHAYYCGIDRIDPTRSRIRESVDSWFEINGLTDEQAAARIREDQIDILVDLNGYTKDSRARVFVLRPAPITGKSFASRVCSSLVTAAGIGEMVCEDQGHYVARAIELGMRPDLLSIIKQKLVTGKQSCLLFDTPRLVHELEDLFA
jgi:predicted O-linked N-acetylglucosamine transferase (SPINDLY family)